MIEYSGKQVTQWMRLCWNCGRLSITDKKILCQYLVVNSELERKGEINVFVELSWAVMDEDDKYYPGTNLVWASSSPSPPVLDESPAHLRNALGNDL
jgi:hypothetical protein